ncbi:flavodoxin family protein [Flavobacterium psychrotrophum]|uniref:flavodoxin family protein n=1 Tax=Flavobacterium psychrotrophum TaxID=2294119 RepID=UPI000E314F69|nr:flavodoxin family protein [Flavobacterium psychrotrophum]
MKALILLGTLKEKGPSNTAILSEFAISYLQKENIECEVVRLAEHNILPGSYITLDAQDDFAGIYEKILGADILIFATPIWWNSHSSELQRIIERLDEVYHIVESGKPSPLYGKLGGVIITGDSDGAEHITGNIANFFTCIGVTVPAYASLGVIWEGHTKGKTTPRAELLKYYEKKYGQDAENMAKSFSRLGNLQKKN